MRKFAIDLRLDDEQLEEFRALCSDERKTVDWLRNWLKDRGCIVARGTVGLYRQYARRPGMARLPALYRIAGEADARRKLAHWMPQLGAGDMIDLASYAGFLAFARGLGAATETGSSQR